MLSKERGCGRRVAGSLYLVVPTSPDGQPIEHFLKCPPRRPNFDLPVQGQLPFWKDGALNLVDYIGETYYPNVCDWIEESRVHPDGISRKVSLEYAGRDAGEDTGISVLEALTPASGLWFAHARAHIDNINDWPDDDWDDETLPWACPKDVYCHPNWDEDLDATPSCVGVYWWDLDGGERIEVPAGVQMISADRLVQRTLPCGASYIGRTRPEGFEPDYHPAIFARFPVVQFELVRGEYGEHLPARERLAGLNLHIPVYEVDE